MEIKLAKEEEEEEEIFVLLRWEMDSESFS